MDRQNRPLSPLHEPLHLKAKRHLKAKTISLQSFLWKGVSLGYVGSIQNLKDWKGRIGSNRFNRLISLVWREVVVSANK